MTYTASGSTGPHLYHKHDTAIVEDGALIGPGTRIWHHAHVRAGARIGSGCVLGKNVFVDSQALIGDHCKIQNNVSVYSGVELGDAVMVGPSAVFTNDRYPRADSPGGWEIVATIVGEGCSIGANATVVCGNTLGPWSMVAAGAVVTKSTEAHELVAGNPARRLGWVCRCGHVLSRSSGPRPDGTECLRCGESLGARL